MYLKNIVEENNLKLFFIWTNSGKNMCCFYGR